MGGGERMSAIEFHLREHEGGFVAGRREEVAAHELGQFVAVAGGERGIELPPRRAACSKSYISRPLAGRLAISSRAASFQAAAAVRLRGIVEEGIFVAIENLLQEGQRFVVFADRRAARGRGTCRGTTCDRSANRRRRDLRRREWAWWRRGTESGSAADRLRSRPIPHGQDAADRRSSRRRGAPPSRPGGWLGSVGAENSWQSFGHRRELSRSADQPGSAIGFQGLRRDGMNRGQNAVSGSWAPAGLAADRPLSRNLLLHLIL